MNRDKLDGALTVIVGALTIVSFFVVLKGADDEPYLNYQRSDFIVQVVVGTSLIALWCCLFIGVMGLVIAGQVSRWWLMMLLWFLVCIFYLLSCPFGYLNDLEQHMLHVTHSL